MQNQSLSASGAFQPTLSADAPSTVVAQNNNSNNQQQQDEDDETRTQFSAFTDVIGGGAASVGYAASIAATSVSAPADFLDQARQLAGRPGWSDQQQQQPQEQVNDDDDDAASFVAAGAQRGGAASQRRGSDGGASYAPSMLSHVSAPDNVREQAHKLTNNTNDQQSFTSATVGAAVLSSDASACTFVVAGGYNNYAASDAPTALTNVQPPDAILQQAREMEMHCAPSFPPQSPPGLNDDDDDDDAIPDDAFQLAMLRAQYEQQLGFYQQQQHQSQQSSSSSGTDCLSSAATARLGGARSSLTLNALSKLSALQQKSPGGDDDGDADDNNNKANEETTVQKAWDVFINADLRVAAPEDLKCAAKAILESRYPIETVIVSASRKLGDMRPDREQQQQHQKKTIVEIREPDFLKVLYPERLERQLSDLTSKSSNSNTNMSPTATSSGLAPAAMSGLPVQESSGGDGTLDETRSVLVGGVSMSLCGSTKMKELLLHRINFSQGLDLSVLPPSIECVDIRGCSGEFPREWPSPSSSSSSSSFSGTNNIQLSKIIVCDNSFFNAITTELLQRLPRTLTHLRLSDNELSGMDLQLGTLPQSLAWLNLSGNLLDGSVDFANLSDECSEINLARNRLEECRGLTKLPSELMVLDLSENAMLRGVFPFSALPPMMDSLDLHGCAMSGVLDLALLRKKCQCLTSLNIAGNDFEGVVDLRLLPKRLGRIDVSGNKRLQGELKFVLPSEVAEGDRDDLAAVDAAAAGFDENANYVCALPKRLCAFIGNNCGFSATLEDKTFRLPDDFEELALEGNTTGGGVKGALAASWKESCELKLGEGVSFV